MEMVSRGIHTPGLIGYYTSYAQYASCAGTTPLPHPQLCVPPGPLLRRTYVRWWGGRLRTHVPMAPNSCSQTSVRMRTHVPPSTRKTLMGQGFLLPACCEALFRMRHHANTCTVGTCVWGTGVRWVANGCSWLAAQATNTCVGWVS